MHKSHRYRTRVSSRDLALFFKQRPRTVQSRKLFVLELIAVWSVVASAIQVEDILKTLRPCGSNDIKHSMNSRDTKYKLSIATLSLLLFGIRNSSFASNVEVKVIE